MTSVAFAFWNAVPDTVGTTEEAHVRSIVTRTLGAAALAAAAIGLAACGSSGSGDGSGHGGGEHQSQPMRSKDGCLLPDPHLSYSEVNAALRGEQGMTSRPAPSGSSGDPEMDELDAGTAKLWSEIPEGGTVKAVEYMCPMIVETSRADAESGELVNEPYLWLLSYSFPACVATDAEIGHFVSSDPSVAANYRSTYQAGKNKTAEQVGATSSATVAAGKYLCPQNFG